MPPLVTCVMPAYNHASYVAEAVLSVLSVANEGLVEVVAVDDASTDGTYEVLKGLDLPGLTVMRNERNVGLAATLRRALERAHTPYVTALASDDRWLPGRLELQLPALERGAEWSFGRAHVIDGAGRRTSRDPQGYVPDHDGMLAMLLRGQAIYAPTLMYRRELLERVGGVLDARWEDLAVTLRFAAVAEPVFHAEALVEYRVHESNLHLGLVEGRQHFAAHTEAVRLLATWKGLPGDARATARDHLEVWTWLEQWAGGEGHLRRLPALPRSAVDGVLERQAADLVRDVPRQRLHRLELALRLVGASAAARALADRLGHGRPVWARAARRILSR